MKEDFLQYIWQLQLFDHSNLQTIHGEEVTILHPGIINRDAGPDFFNAKIYIDKTLWVGNVEIHTQASEWKKHAHQHDEAYNNVILHVSFIHDEPIINHLKIEIPSIELRSRIKLETLQAYENIQNTTQTIPCSHYWQEIPAHLLVSWLDRLLLERIERKATQISAHLQNNKNNWEQTFYELFSQNLGFKVNAEPFLLLAQSLPIQTLAKHQQSLHQIEALLFGQSGLIPTTNEDTYTIYLAKEYQYLKHKYQLKPIPPHIWKFAKMRPVNFPTIRIAQLAKIIHQSTQLFSACINAQNVNQIYELLDVELQHEYWKTHYKFGKDAKPSTKKLGKTAIQNIIINTIIPFMFLYGQLQEQEELMQKALAWLDEIPAENNRITREWEKLNLKIANASTSQSLIELKNEHCILKKCLSCTIGNEILKQTNHDSKH